MGDDWKPRMADLGEASAPVGTRAAVVSVTDANESSTSFASPALQSADRGSVPAAIARGRWLSSDGEVTPPRTLSKPIDALRKLGMRFARDEWGLGVVPQSAEDIVRNGISQPVNWLPQIGPWDYLADPACLALPDGGLILFAEHLNHWVNRGEIWAARIPPSGELARADFRPWLRSSRHLSYPFPFHDENRALFFMAESGEAGALHLWHETGGVLNHVGPIIDLPVIDPTPWYDGTAWWLFCTLRNDGPHQKLHLFRAERLQGPWTAHANNPVKVDRGSCRPAGPLFRADGKLIRPAQDCSQTYGGAVVLHEVVRLDQGGFHEVPLRRLEPDAVYPDGLHTICPAGNVTIIDGKRWAFKAADLPRKFIAWGFNRNRPLRKLTLPPTMRLPT